MYKGSRNDKPFYGTSHIWEVTFRTGAALLTLEKAVVCVKKNKKMHEHTRSLLVFVLPHTIWNFEIASYSAWRTKASQQQKKKKLSNKFTTILLNQ